MNYYNKEYFRLRYLRLKEESKKSLPDAPTCACGCGESVGINIGKKQYSKYISGHNPKKITCPDVVVDLHNPNWLYILGAHLGDGCDSKRLDIAAGNHEHGWAVALAMIMRGVGLKPHTNRGACTRVRARAPHMIKEFLLWKSGGREGIWLFPQRVDNILPLLAGLIDSDGTVSSSSGAIIIFQRNNGNVERLIKWLRLHGETRVHFGSDDRSGQVNKIGNRTVKMGKLIRLGIRGGLRDEVFPFLKNPGRIKEWKEYRGHARQFKCVDERYKIGEDK